MGFWRTVFGLARSPFIGPPVAVAAVLLALAGWFLVPNRYVSTASMVLTVPATGGTLETLPGSNQGLTNPLLQFNDALQTTAGILILAANTPEVAAGLGVTEDGPTTLVINDGRTNPNLLGISTNGPFVYIEVESTSPQVVREVMRKAQLQVKLELAHRQDALDAPISTHIHVLDVMPASAPKPVLQNRLMAAGGGALAGLVGGLALAYAAIRLGAPARVRASATLNRLRPASRKPAEPEADREPEAAPASRNGTHPELPALPVFPLTVAELEPDDGPGEEKAAENAGPIKPSVRDDTLDPTS